MIKNELTIIIPTKDRPKELLQVLKGLAAQTVRPDRVVVVNSGVDVSELVEEFQKSFKIDYLTCKPGQLRQRNLGLDSVKLKTKYVGFLDDDILLKNDAIEKVFSLWSFKGDKVAGVSMNLVNIPKFHHSFLKSLMFLSSKTPGKVLPSGFNVPVHNCAQSFQSEWLPGGCTFWQWTVIDEFRQEPLDTKWAVGEDVRLSYPISLKYQLWVCSDAVAEDLNLGKPRSPSEERFIGFRATISIFYLVQLNPTLSKIACFYMVIAGSVVGMVFRVWDFKSRVFNRAFGQMKAAFVAAFAFLKNQSLRKYLED